jgi:conjugal transfer pilus assembly protein TraK
VKVELNGHEAYVKLEFEVSGQNINYSEIPTEFFIRCGDETFAIIANPRSLPPQTVHMVAPVKKNPDDITLEEASVDKAVVQIFKDVFADKIPQSWDRAKNIYGESKINGIDVVPRTAFYIPGVDVVVNIFGLKTSLAAVPLSEADFLVPELATNPVAIAFNDEDFILSAQDNISLVIIEKTVKER